MVDTFNDALWPGKVKLGGYAVIVYDPSIRASFEPVPVLLPYIHASVRKSTKICIYQAVPEDILVAWLLENKAVPFNGGISKKVRLDLKAQA